MAKGGAHLTTWVAHDMKERFSAVARQQGLSDSALLKRLVELVLSSGSPGAAVGADIVPVDGTRAVRLSIRLRPDDQALLRERSAARGMASATYASVLIRAHLRGLSPLPKEELLAVKRAIAELGSIGRNLNHIVRVVNQGGPASVLGKDDVRTMLRVCQGLRDHVKALLSANTRSWNRG